MATYLYSLFYFILFTFYERIPSYLNIPFSVNNIVSWNPGIAEKRSGKSGMLLMRSFRLPKLPFH